MTKNTPVRTSTPVKQWEKPALVRLGSMRDIAGPNGDGFQAGPNARS